MPGCMRPCLGPRSHPRPLAPSERGAARARAPGGVSQAANKSPMRPTKSMEPCRSKERPKAPPTVPGIGNLDESEKVVVMKFNVADRSWSNSEARMVIANTPFQEGVCGVVGRGGGGGGVGWGFVQSWGTARQGTDGLWTEVCGQQKQSNDLGNNPHILNTPIVGRR